MKCSASELCLIQHFISQEKRCMQCMQTPHTEFVCKDGGNLGGVYMEEGQPSW